MTNCYTDTKIPVKAVEMPHEASSKSEFQFGTWEKKSADIALKKESLATSVNEKRGYGFGSSQPIFRFKLICLYI